MKQKRLPSPSEPRLPDDLEEIRPSSLEETTAWTDVVVEGGETGVPQMISSLDISCSAVRGLRLTARRIYNVRAIDVVFEDCELSGATLSDAALNRVRFQQCRLSGADLSGTRAQAVSFIDCRADDVDLRLSSWEASRFEDCDLRNVDFSESVVATSGLIRCNLDEADFSNVRMDAVALHGSTLENVVGAASLRGAVIGTDQLVPLSPTVFTALGITIDDDYLDGT